MYFQTMNLFWKRGGTKFIFPYWHSNQQRNTSSTAHARSTWSQPVVIEIGTGKEPAEKPRGAGRLGGFPFPLVSTSFSPSMVKQVTSGFFSPPGQPLQFYHKENCFGELVSPWCTAELWEGGKSYSYNELSVNQTSCFSTLSVYKKLWLPF